MEKKNLHPFKNDAFISASWAVPIFSLLKCEIKSNLTLKPTINSIQSFIAWKIQILIRRVIAGKTGKRKRYTDRALKKEQKPRTKCNMTI